MVQSNKRVWVTLKVNPIIAREVAEATWFRINPHQSQLVEDRLTKAGVNIDVLTRYFVELSKAVSEFWNNTADMQFQMVMKPHEMRGLYLPLMYGIVFSSVGNLKKGNYEYCIKAMVDEKPDRKFLIETSATLESLRDIVRGDIGQIGNRSAMPQEAVMMSILGELASDERSAQMHIRDGVTVDQALAGLAVLAGVSLVETAYSILYTGVEEVNFRQLTNTLVDKDLMALKKGVPAPDQ